MDDFITQQNLCWLYCPDSVINKASDFLKVMEGGCNAEEEKNAVGEFLLEIRKDLIQNEKLNSTQLTSTDFRLYNTNAGKILY